jgi:protease IV
MFAILFKLLRMYLMSIGVVVSLVVVVVVSLFSKPNLVPQVTKDDIILHMKLNGEIVDYKQKKFDLSSLFSKSLSKKYYLLDIKESLEKAAKDDHVKALFLEIGSYNSSYALTSDFRNLLKEFKKSGKKLYVWFSSADSHKYYLASVGDEVSMPKSGNIQLIGPYFSFTYVGKALEKIGVATEIIKTGNYKSLFEWLISNKMSSSTKEMFESLETDLRLSIVEDISDDRKLSNKEEVNSWFKRSFYSVQEAFNDKILDSISYIHSYKKKLTKEFNAEMFLWSDYKKTTFFEKKKSSLSAIALIDIHGEIKDDSGMGFSSETVTYNELEKEIQWAHDSEEIKSVMIRISSPGGSALASDQIWAIINDLKKKKPVVVSMGDVAASGGYYIASPATKIFSYKTTLTGSIGVVSARPSLGNFEKLYGISFSTITGSDRKNFLNLGERLSEVDKNILQKMTNSVYDEFLAKVSSGRDLPISYVRSIAQGRVWSGAQAKKHKLVDAIGGFSEALEETKVKGGFSKYEKVSILRWQPEISSIYDCLKSIKNLKYCSSSASVSIGSYLKQKSFVQEYRSVLQQAKKINLYAL